MSMDGFRQFSRLLEIAKPLPPVRMAVAAPEDANSLGGALLAASEGLIEPVLVGDEGRIRAAADGLGRTVEHEIVHVDGDHEAAAARAVALLHEGRAASLMKGALHTDEILGAVVRRETGLRVGKRLSHVFVQDVPGRDRLLLVTDAALNIAPDLDEKADILQNAIDLAHSLRIETPRAAVLSATEKVNPKIPATEDAAALAAMADEGRITGGHVQGPLAMDLAVSAAAAQTKGIEGEVAGRADILLVPEIQSGNILFKALTYLAGAMTGGVVLGAKCPIVLTSRSDDDDARLASCVVAVLHASAGRTS